LARRQSFEKTNHHNHFVQPTGVQARPPVRGLTVVKDILLYTAIGLMEIPLAARAARAEDLSTAAGPSPAGKFTTSTHSNDTALNRYIIAQLLIDDEISTEMPAFRQYRQLTRRAFMRSNPDSVSASACSR
jgi:hypothetical protein